MVVCQHATIDRERRHNRFEVERGAGEPVNEQERRFAVAMVVVAQHDLTERELVPEPRFAEPRFVVVIG
jgi:hypothetical protein